VYDYGLEHFLQDSERLCGSHLKHRQELQDAIPLLLHGILFLFKKAGFVTKN
jgi:hypothetical protein